jgi:superkiller protein 3
MMKISIGLLSLALSASAACTKADQESTRPTSEPSKPPAESAPGAMIAAEAVEPREPGASAKEISVTSRSAEAAKLFREARDLSENFRHAESEQKLAKALELDPDFALAHALYAWSQTGSARDEHVGKARELAAQLPEAERLMVESMAFKAEGNEDKAHELTDKLVVVAPGDWRVQMLAAYRAQSQGEIDQAIGAYERATTLNPQVAQPHNNLAYLYSDKGELDKALTSIERYAALESGPNPHDSKGEILLMNGKFEQAEAAFQKAIDVSPEFAIAMEGIAVARMYRGDTKGAFEAFEQARKAARDMDREKLGHTAVWLHVAAGQGKQAYAAVAAVEKANKARGEKLASLWAALGRAEVGLALGDT